MYHQALEVYTVLFTWPGQFLMPKLDMKVKEADLLLSKPEVVIIFSTIATTTTFLYMRKNTLEEKAVSFLYNTKKKNSILQSNINPECNLVNLLQIQTIALSLDKTVLAYYMY